MSSSRRYSRWSALFAGLSVFLAALTIGELPRNDGVHGRWINAAMRFSEADPHTVTELRALSPHAITEARIVSIVFIGIFVFAVLAVVTGLWARKRGEDPRMSAVAVALSIVLMVVASSYASVVSW